MCLRRQDVLTGKEEGWTFCRSVRDLCVSDRSNTLHCGEVLALVEGCGFIADGQARNN